MLELSDREVSLYQCIFQGNFQKALINIRFPCKYFIEWKTINGKNVVLSQKQCKSSTDSVNFQECLRFSTQLIYDKKKKKFLKKQSFIHLNLTSNNRPDQVKLIGRITIDLGDVINNKNNYQAMNTYKLNYCSVEASLVFNIKFIKNTHLNKSISELDKSSFHDLYSFKVPTPHSTKQTQNQDKSLEILKNDKILIDQKIVHSDEEGKGQMPQYKSNTNIVLINQKYSEQNGKKNYNNEQIQNKRQDIPVIYHKYNDSSQKNNSKKELLIQSVDSDAKNILTSKKQSYLQIKQKEEFIQQLNIKDQKIKLLEIDLLNITQDLQNERIKYLKFQEKMQKDQKNKKLQNQKMTTNQRQKHEVFDINKMQQKLKYYEKVIEQCNSNKFTQLQKRFQEIKQQNIWLGKQKLLVQNRLQKCQHLLSNLQISQGRLKRDLQNLKCQYFQKLKQKEMQLQYQIKKYKILQQNFNKQIQIKTQELSSKIAQLKQLNNKFSCQTDRPQNLNTFQNGKLNNQIKLKEEQYFIQLNSKRKQISQLSMKILQLQNQTLSQKVIIQQLSSTVKTLQNIRPSESQNITQQNKKSKSSFANNAKKQPQISFLKIQSKDTQKHQKEIAALQQKIKNLEEQNNNLQNKLIQHEHQKSQTKKAMLILKEDLMNYSDRVRQLEVQLLKCRDPSNIFASQQEKSGSQKSLKQKLFLPLPRQDKVSILKSELQKVNQNLHFMAKDKEHLLIENSNLSETKRFLQQQLSLYKQQNQKLTLELERFKLVASSLNKKNKQQISFSLSQTKQQIKSDKDTSQKNQKDNRKILNPFEAQQKSELIKQKQSSQQKTQQNGMDYVKGILMAQLSLLKSQNQKLNQEITRLKININSPIQQQNVNKFKELSNFSQQLRKQSLKQVANQQKSLSPKKTEKSIHEEAEQFIKSIEDVDNMKKSKQFHQKQSQQDSHRQNQGVRFSEKGVQLKATQVPMLKKSTQSVWDMQSNYSMRKMSKFSSKQKSINSKHTQLMDEGHFGLMTLEDTNQSIQLKEKIRQLQKNIQILESQLKIAKEQIQKQKKEKSDKQQQLQKVWKQKQDLVFEMMFGKESLIKKPYQTQDIQYQIKHTQISEEQIKQKNQRQKQKTRIQGQLRDQLQKNNGRLYIDYAQLAQISQQSSQLQQTILRASNLQDTFKNSDPLSDKHSSQNAKMLSRTEHVKQGFIFLQEDNRRLRDQLNKKQGKIRQEDEIIHQMKVNINQLTQLKEKYQQKIINYELTLKQRQQQITTHEQTIANLELKIKLSQDRIVVLDEQIKEGNKYRQNPILNIKQIQVNSKQQLKLQQKQLQTSFHLSIVNNLNQIKVDPFQKYKLNLTQKILNYYFQPQRNQQNALISKNMLIEQQQKYSQLQENYHSIIEQTESYADKKIQQLQNKIADYVCQVKQKDELIKQLEMSVQETYGLKYQLAQLKQNQQETHLNLIEKQQQIQSLTQNINVLKQQLQNIQKQSDNNAQNHNDDYKQLEINSLKQHINQLQVQKNQLNLQINSLRDQSVNISQNYSKVKTQNQHLKKDFIKLNDDYSVIQNKLDNAYVQIDKVKSQLAIKTGFSRFDAELKLSKNSKDQPRQSTHSHQLLIVSKGVRNQQQQKNDKDSQKSKNTHRKNKDQNRQQEKHFLHQSIDLRKIKQNNSNEMQIQGKQKLRLQRNISQVNIRCTDLEKKSSLSNNQQTQKINSVNQQKEEQSLQLNKQISKQPIQKIVQIKNQNNALREQLINLNKLYNQLKKQYEHFKAEFAYIQSQNSRLLEQIKKIIPSQIKFDQTQQTQIKQEIQNLNNKIKKLEIQNNQLKGKQGDIRNSKAFQMLHPQSSFSTQIRETAKFSPGDLKSETQKSSTIKRQLVEVQQDSEKVKDSEQYRESKSQMKQVSHYRIDQIKQKTQSQNHQEKANQSKQQLQILDENKNDISYRSINQSKAQILQDLFFKDQQILQVQANLDKQIRIIQIMQTQMQEQKAKSQQYARLSKKHIKNIEQLKLQNDNTKLEIIKRNQQKFRLNQKLQQLQNQVLVLRQQNVHQTNKLQKISEQLMLQSKKTKEQHQENYQKFKNQNEQFKTKLKQSQTQIYQLKSIQQKHIQKQKALADQLAEQKKNQTFNEKQIQLLNKKIEETQGQKQYIISQERTAAQMLIEARIKQHQDQHSRLKQKLSELQLKYRTQSFQYQSSTAKIRQSLHQKTQIIKQKDKKIEQLQQKISFFINKVSQQQKKTIQLKNYRDREIQSLASELKLSSQKMQYKNQIILQRQQQLVKLVSQINATKIQCESAKINFQKVKNKQKQIIQSLISLETQSLNFIQQIKQKQAAQIQTAQKHENTQKQLQNIRLQLHTLKEDNQNKRRQLCFAQQKYNHLVLKSSLQSSKTNQAQSYTKLIQSNEQLLNKNKQYLDLLNKKSVISVTNQKKKNQIKNLQIQIQMLENERVHKQTAYNKNLQMIKNESESVKKMYTGDQRHLQDSFKMINNLHLLRHESKGLSNLQKLVNAKNEEIQQLKAKINLMLANRGNLIKDQVQKTEFLIREQQYIQMVRELKQQMKLLQNELNLKQDSQLSIQSSQVSGSDDKQLKIKNYINDLMNIIQEIGRISKIRYQNKNQKDLIKTLIEKNNYLQNQLNDKSFHQSQKRQISLKESKNLNSLINKQIIQKLKISLLKLSLQKQQKQSILQIIKQIQNNQKQ